MVSSLAITIKYKYGQQMAHTRSPTFPMDNRGDGDGHKITEIKTTFRFDVNSVCIMTTFENPWIHSILNN